MTVAFEVTVAGALLDSVLGRVGSSGAGMGEAAGWVALGDDVGGLAASRGRPPLYAISRYLGCQCELFKHSVQSCCERGSCDTRPTCVTRASGHSCESLAGSPSEGAAT